MEQAGCWLVPNRTPKCISDESSWEERAFAEDIGGCVWPPRSYSCNFCRREFRSAQALGGHMNVHRRDRARLKLLSNTTKSNHLSNQSNTFAPHNNKDQNPSLFSSNNPESHPFVSSFLVNNNTHEKTLSFFCLSNDTNGKNNKDLLPFKITKNHDMMMKASNNHPFIGLSTGSVAAADDDDEAPNNPNKRRKVDTSSSSPLVVTKITKKVEDHTPKKVNDSHEIEELDLELRLGDRPKVQ